MGVDEVFFESDCLELVKELQIQNLLAHGRFAPWSKTSRNGLSPRDGPLFGVVERNKVTHWLATNSLGRNFVSQSGFIPPKVEVLMTIL
ncbi:hypothetical protein RHMOL_Rhmol11G0052000 [Rhododendron molle]|uniref:Uncharacterized protein n=1 Tax=Rhododendron molle TaxID=49168 RepID=A0ACC0LP63_RHOML|nr:hypothetical protein RHMOL_Rhmol11G0052000 [Rhododendron molle]